MMKQGGRLFLILAAVSAGFFCTEINFCQAVSQGDVVINEIAWMGTEVSTFDEWMELKNLSAEEINLDGWSLVAQDGAPEINLAGVISAGSFFLLERTDDNSVLGVVADLIYAGALGNTGEILELFDGEGNLIDAVEALGSWPAGDNDNKKTMERQGGGSWQTSAEVGGTPRAENSESESEDSAVSPEDDIGEEEYQEELSQETEIFSTESEDGDIFISYDLGDVVINELVSDPADGEVEWIELYNKIDEEIDLSGWSIEEGSGAKTELKSVIGNNTFYVIEKPAGNLNNSGDVIILLDGSGNLIDQVAYGEWDDGDISNNAPLANDPYSIARKLDWQNSYNNAHDFALTTTPTKAKSNIITLDEESEELSWGERQSYDYSQDIFISEIFPNPAGNDGETEFIELFNGGEREVDLKGWRIGDESKRKFELSAVIKPGAYDVMYRSESKVALNNGGDSVKLFQPLKDEPLRVVQYDRAVEDWSYNMGPGGRWEWSEIITPGAVNEIKAVNHPPVVEFDCPETVLAGEAVAFDSSDTFDEDEDELEFEWDFGDGVRLKIASPGHTFLKTGMYAVKLTVSDGKEYSEKEKVVKVVADAEFSKNIATELPYSADHTGLARNNSVIINEILPNPTGSDSEGEWIEIYNQSKTAINLLNWQIDDSEDGSQAYKITEDFLLEPAGFRVIYRVDSGLALNNDNDAVRLFDGQGELVNEIKYEQVVEGEAYARGENDKWFWTTSLTPGGENIISVSDSKQVGEEIFSLPENKNAIREVAPEEARECEVGELVKARGVVAVEPGILGSQYFYIVGSPGIQVYNYKKDFPLLRIGDYIEVGGEISISGGEKRIKTKTADDFKLLERREPPQAEELNCENINEDYIGSLVSVTGEVLERRGSTLYLDDGTDEVEIYVKNTTGINIKDIGEGEIITVRGLVKKTISGVRIMPRSGEDIIKKDIESQTGEAGRVLGEVAASDEWEIAARDKKLELFKYLLVLAGGMIVVLGGLLIKVAIGKD